MMAEFSFLGELSLLISKGTGKYLVLLTISDPQPYVVGQCSQTVSAWGPL